MGGDKPWQCQEALSNHGRDEGGNPTSAARPSCHLNQHTLSGDDWLQNLRAPPNPSANTDMAIRSPDNHGHLVLHRFQSFAWGRVSWEAQDAVP